VQVVCTKKTQKTLMSTGAGEGGGN